MMSGMKRMGRKRVERAIALTGAVALAMLALPDGLTGLEAQSAAARGPAQPVAALAGPVALPASGALPAPAGIAAVSERAQEDPADSLYKAAREALNRGAYSQAAKLFREIRDTYPESKYVPDTYYFEAFALYRQGGRRDLINAVALLAYQQERHANAATSGDATSLRARIEGELARQGDAAAAERMAEVEVAPEQESCDEEDLALRIAALQSLMQMDSDRAEPILRKVLARRDECSRELRANAVFIVADQGGPEAEGILLEVARTDPDVEVRRQAVFWLSDVGSDRAVTALDSILNDPNSEPDVQEQAIFAIAETGSERAADILRRYIRDSSHPDELRAHAIFWLGESEGEVEADFLRELYSQVDDDELRNQILFVLSEVGGEENRDWLLARAMDPNESGDIRQQALFWAQEAGVETSDLIRLYDTASEPDLKEYLIFVLAERDDDESIEKLIQIARSGSDEELRKKALFWVAESGDPRAEELLMEILEQ